MRGRRPIQPAPTSIAVPVPAGPQWPEPGQAARDIRAGSFRLAEQKGKPIVLVFFKPAGETTDLALAVADALEKRYAGNGALAPLVVGGEMSTALQARDRLKFSIPIYDGSPTAPAYGMETVPRFAVIDAAGKVRWTFTGIGAESRISHSRGADRLVSQLPHCPARAMLRPVRSACRSYRRRDCRRTGSGSRIQCRSPAHNGGTRWNGHMTDYEIRGPTRLCGTTGRELKPGDRFHAHLTERDGSSSAPTTRPKCGPARAPEAVALEWPRPGRRQTVSPLSTTRSCSVASVPAKDAADADGLNFRYVAALP